MRLVVLPGDGIGPEITAATMQVLRRADALFSLGLAFEEHEIGLARLAREGSTLPEQVIEAARAADGIVLGPVDSYAYPPRDKGGINVSGEMRIRFDLYANIRPSRSRPGLPHYGRTPMDLVIVRENTEGFYADRNMHLGIGEFMPTPDLALSVRKISAEGSSRIARAAFELAMRRPRRKVTAVHKHNVLKVTEGLFLREVRKVAEQFPDVAYDEQLVDSMAALLVRDAQRYDVVVTTNMYGDILSDEASELSGSLGLAGSINHSDTHGMAQAQHGSAPDIAGQDKANPVSLILSAAMLLDWHARRAEGRENFARAAAAIEQVADELIADPGRRTADLGGRLGTRAFAEAFCGALTA
ncbi:isocitrate/isopropylmalate dehydrogenase family protein [Falsiroseomonas sp.]|uniref:isocitrate/isopropylmalate dehydrogenase family protein n=1 Tax=Falsiroseomonas sp. TaxID=2870721 RepID=UPI0035698A52